MVRVPELTADSLKPNLKMSSEELSSTVHRLFLVAYSITAALAIFVSVSSGVVTNYWQETIDGCILYADIHENTVLPASGHSNGSSQSHGAKGPHSNSSSSTPPWSMIGSELSVCHYVTFTPVFFVFICLLCISYHARHLLCKHCWRAEESDVKTDFWEMMVRLLVVLSAVMTLLSLIVACVLTHGHDYTCSGLRRYVTSQGLSPWLGISSAQIHELFDRLDCGFFYSALDHGLKIVTDHLEEEEEMGKVGKAVAIAAASQTIIDSNSALEVAMATGWFQFVFWLALTLGNFWLAHRLKVQLLPDSVNLPALPGFLNKE